MPVYDRSYRRWEGTLKRGGARWAPIAVAGLRRSLQARATVLRSIVFYGFVFGSLVPGLILLLLNYAYWFPPKFLAPELLEQLDFLSAYQKAQYSFLLFLSGSVLIPLWAVLFGSGTIAQDRASLALPLYLSRPLTLRDYLFGKFAVVATMLSCLTFLPCLTIFVLGVVATPAPVGVETLRTLAGLLVHCSLLVAVHASGVMACSALCRRPMTAAAAWFGLVFAISVLSTILREVLELNAPSALDVNRAATTIAYAVLDLDSLESLTGGTELLKQIGVRPYAPVPLCLLAVAGMLAISWWVVVRSVRRHHQESQG